MKVKYVSLFYDNVLFSDVANPKVIFDAIPAVIAIPRHNIIKTFCFGLILCTSIILCNSFVWHVFCDPCLLEQPHK
jgi:hypothetical protein